MKNGIGDEVVAPLNGTVRAYGEKGYILGFVDDCKLGPVDVRPKTVSVSLTAAGWDSTAKTQTVAVPGVLADETAQLITPTPAVASQSAYYAAGILCTGQAADSLTFTADTVPTEDLTVYVVIQDVIPPKVTLISFTIAGTSYQAEDGMTWGEWVESEYNTNGYQIDNQGDGNGLYIQLDGS